MRTMFIQNTGRRRGARLPLLEWFEGEPFHPRVIALDGPEDLSPWRATLESNLNNTQQKEKQMKLRDQIAIVASLVLFVGCSQDDQKASQNPPGSSGMVQEAREARSLTPPPAAVTPAPASAIAPVPAVPASAPDLLATNPPTPTNPPAPPTNAPDKQ